MLNEKPQSGEAWNERGGHWLGFSQSGLFAIPLNPHL
jgi:hypothetical protein